MGGGGVRRVAYGRSTVTCYLAVARRHHRISAIPQIQIAVSQFPFFIKEAAVKGCLWSVNNHFLSGCCNETSSDFSYSPDSDRSKSISFFHQRFNKVYVFHILSYRLHITRLM